MATTDAAAWTAFSAPITSSGALPKLNALLQSDAQLLAFTSTPALASPIVFNLSSASEEAPLTITVSSSGNSASTNATPAAPLFTLTAQPDQWHAFFARDPLPPFHTYWGIRFAAAMGGAESVKGSLDDFARFAHIWRRVLELLRDALAGPALPDTAADDEATDTDDDDADIVGGYVRVTAPNWGRCRVFHEASGTGATQILFLHTAGSDGRQVHALMQSAALRARFRMHVFDMPGHGRSLLGARCVAGGYAASEDDFVAVVAGVIAALKLDRPILCGASMAGNLCLAAAIRNADVRAGGVIPLQACEHLALPRGSWDRSPFVNGALICPESVYGTMSPSTPTKNKQLMWQTYSAQGYGVLAADLGWYFGGWDGRGRVEAIGCPVYMLTGEHDIVNPPSASEATAAKIPGAVFKSMPALGHFPLAEKPRVFEPFLIEAVRHIVERRAGPA